MKTKKLLSFLLAIVMVFSMMTIISINASANPATDQFIKVGETQVIRAEGIYSSETADGNYYYISVADVSTPSVTKNNISIESVDQDGNEMVITIKGVAVTDEDETVDILAKVYRKDESDWVDAAIQCGYHVVPAEDAEYLDLDDSTTAIPEKKELDQNYNLAVSGEYTNVTKVKLSWEIDDINITKTGDNVLNTTDLCWTTSNSSTSVSQNGTANFTLENYSSIKVDATVTFDTAEYAVGKKFTAPTLVFDEDNDENTEDDGVITLDTANGNDTYSMTNVPTGKISVINTPKSDDFKTLAVTTTATKFGIYTVTISKNLPSSFVFAKFYDGEASNATVNDMNASALCKYMVDNDMISDASQFGSVLVKSTYYSKLEKKFITESKALSLLFDTTHQEYGTVTNDTLVGDSDYNPDKAFEKYFNGSFTWDGSSFAKNS